MPRVAPKAVVARADRAYSSKLPWYDLHYECWYYAAPGLNPFEVDGGNLWERRGQSSGSPRHDHLYDSTLARASAKLANRVINDTFAPGVHWAELAAGARYGVALSDHDRNAKVKAVEDAVFGVVNRGRTYLSLVLMALDSVVSGTGLIKVGRNSVGEVTVEAVNQAEVAFEAGLMGDVWGFYRKLEMEAAQIVAKWPQAKRVPEDDPAVRTEGREPKKYTVYEGTYYDPTTGWWYYDVILRGDGAEEERLLFSHDYAVPPWLTWRWSLVPGEVQGRSPVMAALPDARTANGAVQSILRGASLRALGVWTALDDAILNLDTTDFAPGSIIPVQSNDSSNPSLRALDVGGDANLQSFTLEDQRASIRQTMLDDMLPDPAGPVRSATEIIERQRQARQALGLPAARLIEEIGRPLLAAIAYHLHEAGELDELAEMQPVMADGRVMPLKLDGTDIEVKFQSPLVQAQRLTDASTIVEWGEYSLRTAGPRAFESGAKPELIPSVLGEKMGIDSRLWRPADEAEQRMEQMQQQQALPAPGGAESDAF